MLTSQGQLMGTLFGLQGALYHPPPVMPLVLPWSRALRPCFCDRDAPFPPDLGSGETLLGAEFQKPSEDVELHKTELDLRRV